MKIDLPVEFIDAVIISDLSWHLKHLRNNQKPPMFSFDPKEEKEKVKELRDALKCVLRFYGVDK